MARIELITGEGELSPEVRAVSDRIVETRGEVSRPFEVLLHSPEIAERVAELGHLVRSDSSLSDADRELVTLATGRATGCRFIWTSHLEAASAAGLSAETVASVEGDGGALDPRETTLVAFVDELCATGEVSAATYAAAHELLGTRAMVDLAVTVGYYAMLAQVMGAFEAC